MLEAIYTIISIIVFFKLMKFMIKATWGLAKFVVAIIFWPIVIIAAICGLIWLVLPILIIVGLISAIAAA
ncbi:MAG: hypothetical protein K6G42_02625 [Lachnospiraceae bacterium]|nr:hypothetical protein [Lachnospiraceae bacterium]